ncbi:VanZ family protein [Fictibacillus nanhaiensis]|uniref:VanZ family protein n=1 Tax=Fictibacillus nanhaiensis TaxID=742169 RepID=UPI002E1B0E23|nr:VanZ family protein [Fictibacillus nanhaiensis]
MLFIWMQSSYFNPEEIFRLSAYVPYTILLAMGAAFELAHLFEFGVLYLLFILLLLSYGSLTRKKERLSFIAAFSYGVIDEVHQMFVPYRSASVVDLIKNTIGITVVWYIIHQHYFYKTKSVLGEKLRKVTAFSK